MNALSTFVLALTITSAGAVSAGAVENGFTDLFNGKDLTGWTGLEGFWSVQDGVIVGESTDDHKLRRNTFLIWRGGEPGDFELRFDVRLTSNNSGLQYRSREATSGDAKDYSVMWGYQCDIGGAWEHYGKMYEEGGRGRIGMGGEQVEIPPGTKHMGQKVLGPSAPLDQVKTAAKPKDWNAMVIIAHGNHLQHFVNGVRVVDLVDLDEKARRMKGLIGLQIHAGSPTKVEARNLRIKLLDATPAPAP